MLGGSELIEQTPILRIRLARIATLLSQAVDRPVFCFDRVRGLAVPDVDRGKILP
jgi:hypothetical protein